MLEGGDGPPMVLLAAEFAAVWLRVIPDLVATHRVIAPDLPGLGASEVTDGPIDVDYWAWPAELIDATCAVNPVLVGKGPAGALAALFAMDHGGHLDHLVLVDGYGLDRFRPSPAMALTFVSVLLRPTDRGLQRSFRKYCYVDLDRVRAEMGESYDWMSAYALDRCRTSSVKATARGLLARLSSTIPAQDLDRITVPTTLIWGRQDVGMRPHVAESASRRHGWPLYVIDDARDDPAVEQPAAFLEALGAPRSDRGRSRR